MDGVTVTNGSVSYSRTARPADFENKTPGVNLTYIINEGVDPERATQFVMGIAFRTVEAVHRTGMAPPMQQVQQQPQETVKQPDPTPDASTESAPSGQVSALASGSASNTDAKGPTADTGGGVVRRKRRTAAQIAADEAAKGPTAETTASLGDMLGPDPSVKVYEFDDVYKVVSEAVKRLTDAGQPGDALHAALIEAGSAEGRLAGVPKANWPKLVELVEKIAR